MNKAGNMEVKINGDNGPAIKFSVGLVAIIQVVLTAASFAAAMRIAQADIQELQQGQKVFLQKVDEMLRLQIRMESRIETLSEEVRYYREKLDRHVEAQK
jgi:hypothetical protein